MQNFLVVYMILQTLAAILRLYYLACGEYPRQSETSSAGEVVQLVVGCAFLFWAGKLLWG